MHCAITWPFEPYSVLYSYGFLAGLGVPHSTDCKAHRDIIVLEYVKATDLI